MIVLIDFRPSNIIGFPFAPGATLRVLEIATRSLLLVVHIWTFCLDIIEITEEEKEEEETSI